MRITTQFEALNPIDVSDVQVIASNPAFHELELRVLSEPPGTAVSVSELPSFRVKPPSKMPRRATVLTLGAAMLVVVALVVAGSGSGPSKVPTNEAAHASGTWKLADDPLGGTWQQYTSGPPPGTLSCPTTSTCYTMSGKYASPEAGSPVLSESLYVSTDSGVTWSALAMPQGFASTSPISCGAESDCAAGGTANGQPVLATTTDGGRSWALDPLPAGVGHLDTVSCPTSTYCAGLAADSEYLQLGTTDATFLVTSDGGKTFSDEPIIQGDSMETMACPDTHDCTAIGWNDALGPNDWTAGVAARTTNGGQSWSAANLPEGLGVDYLSRLSCADASHCSMTGIIAIDAANPPQCAELHQSYPGNSSVTTPLSPQSPAVSAIAQAEARAEAEQGRRDTGSNGFSCQQAGAQTDTGAIASSQDGGLSWTPDALPNTVPEPTFIGLSCPTASQCWATGSDSVPEQVGTSQNGGSPILLGTDDGGATWSAVTFSPPQGAPNDLGQSYLSMGSISCPSLSTCVSLGIGAQSAPSVPTYRTVSERPN